MCPNQAHRRSGSVNMNINANCMALPRPPPPPGQFSCDFLPHQHTNTSSDPTPMPGVRMSMHQLMQFIRHNLPTPLNDRDDNNLRNLLNDHSHDIKIMWTNRSTPPGLGHAAVCPPTPMPMSASIHAPATWRPGFNAGAGLRTLAPTPASALFSVNYNNGEVTPATAPGPAPASRSASASWTARASSSNSTNYNNIFSNSSQSAVHISGHNVHVRSTGNSTTMMSNHPIQWTSTVMSNTHSIQRVSTYHSTPHDQSRWPVRLRRSKYDTMRAHPTYENSGVTKPAHKNASSKHRVGNRRSNHGPPQGLHESFYFPHTHPAYPHTYPYEAKSHSKHQRRPQPSIEFDDGFESELDWDSNMPTPQLIGRNGSTRNSSSHNFDIDKLARNKERFDCEKSAKDRRKEARDRHKESRNRHKEARDHYKERRQYEKQFRRDYDREPFRFISDTEDDITDAPPGLPPINTRHGMNDTRLLMVPRKNGNHKLRFGTGGTDLGDDYESVADDSATVYTPSRTATGSTLQAPAQTPDIGGIYAFQMLATSNMAIPEPSRDPVFAPASTSAEAMANLMETRKREAVKNKQKPQSSARQSVSTGDASAPAPARTSAEVMANSIKVRDAEKAKLKARQIEAQQPKSQRVPQSPARKTIPAFADPVVKVESDADIDDPVVKAESDTETDDPVIVVKIESGIESSPGSTPVNIAADGEARPPSSCTLGSDTMTSGTIFSPSPRPKKRVRDDTDDVEVQRGGVKRPIKKARLSRAI